MNQPGYLSTLTPLRGIAALFVVVHHAQAFGSPVAALTTTHFVFQSWLWVDFFFVLSGFVLYHVYGNLFSRSVTKKQFWGYMSARFARVYPLHFFTLVWATGMAVVIRHEASSIDPLLATMFSYWAFPASLFLVQAFHLFPIPPLNTPAWSLSTEWWVYVLFPALAYGLRASSASGKWLILLGTLALYVLLMYYVAPVFSIVHKVTMNVMTDWGFFRCLVGFVIGMLCYEVYTGQVGRRWVGSGLFFVVVFAATLLTMHLGMNDLLTIGLFPCVILSAAYQSGWVKRILNVSIFQRLGDWSFSIYMVHVPIIYIFFIPALQKNPDLLARFVPGGPANPNYAHGQQMAVIVVVLTLIVAAFTYRFIEVPARNYLNARFSTRREEPIAVAM